MRKIILLMLTSLIMIGCNMAMDELNVGNGTKYIVISKAKKAGEPCYRYKLIKLGDHIWYDYNYKDTTNFEIGDTLLLTIEKNKP